MKNGSAKKFLTTKLLFLLVFVSGSLAIASTQDGTGEASENSPAAQSQAPQAAQQSINASSIRYLSNEVAVIGGAVAGGVPGAAAAFTVGELINVLNDGIKDTANEVEEKLIADLRKEIAVLTSQINNALHDNIKTPIKDLSGSLRYAADRGLLVANLITAANKSLAQCATSDVRLMMELTLLRVKDITKNWDNSESLAGIPVILGQDGRFGFFTKEQPTSVSFKGIYSDLDTKCEETAATLTSPEQKVTELQVMSSSEEQITVLIPGIATEGIYKAKLSYSSSKFWDIFHLFCKKHAVESYIVVGKPPDFVVEWSLSAKVKGWTKQRGGVNRTKSGDEKAKSINVGTPCAPPGSRFLGCGCNPPNGNNCSCHSAPRGTCCDHTISCTRDDGHITALFTIDYETYEDKGVYDLVVDTKMLPAIRTESTRTFTLPSYDRNAKYFEGGDPAYLCSWTVGAKIRGMRGQVIDIPAKTADAGASSVDASNGQGASVSWNPIAGTLSVTTPPYMCDFIQY